jgi:hypothetical protein
LPRLIPGTPFDVIERRAGGGMFGVLDQVVRGTSHPRYGS